MASISISEAINVREKCDLARPEVNQLHHHVIMQARIGPESLHKKTLMTFDGTEPRKVLLMNARARLHKTDKTAGFTGGHILNN